MKTIWVLENIREHSSFYNKFDLLMMFASVIQWKKHHPSFHTHVFLDKLTYDTFSRIGALELWDSYENLPTSKSIDKNVFWASSKLVALRSIEEPIVIMDNDFVVYKSFENFLKDKIVATLYEDGKGYYANPLNPYIKKVKHIINRPKTEALNCSFLYFPDYKFTQYYAKTSIELMEEFTKLKVPDSTYLIYAEQLLLKHLINLHKIEYDTLLDKEFLCSKKIYTKERPGLINTESHNLYFRHYWMEKPDIRANKKGFSYNEEITQLENIVNNRILLDWDKL